MVTNSVVIRDFDVLGWLIVRPVPWSVLGIALIMHCPLVIRKRGWVAVFASSADRAKYTSPALPAALASVESLYWGIGRSSSVSVVVPGLALVSIKPSPW